LTIADPMGRLSRSFLSRYATPAILVCVGVGLSIWGFSTTRRWNAAERRSLFAEASREAVARLSGLLASHELILESLAAFYAGSEYVSRQEFREFVNMVLAGHTNIHALAWLPVVPAGRRGAFEREAAASGVPGFEITSPVDGGRPVPADSGVDCFPVLYVSPTDANSGLLGMDWGGVPGLRLGLEQARDGDRMVTAGMWDLPGNYNGPTLATILPVYTKGAWVQSVESRREHIEGFLVQIYNPCEILGEGFLLDGSRNVGLQIAMIRDAASGVVIYDGGIAPALVGASDRDVEISEAEGRLWGVAGVAFGGASWTVVSVPGPGLKALSGSWVPWLVLVAGLLLFGGVAVHLINVTKTSYKVSWYADELRATQTELERKLSENLITQKTLHESERYLKVIFDTVSTGILVIDPESHAIVDANRAAASMVGIRREHLVGRRCQGVICPAADGDCPVTDRGEILDNTELSFMNVSGEEVPSLRTVVPIVLKGKKHLLDCFVDIGVQKRAQAAAERESAKLSAMISGMDEGVVFADAENVITKVNAYFCRFVGKGSDEILTRHVEDFHAGPVMEHVDRLIQGFRSDIHSGPFTIQRRLGDAEVLLRMQPIYRGGGYDGVLLNVIDVSDLVGARRLAEEATRVKSEFLANMSHEIRTPMTAIMGYADLLSGPGLDDKDRLEYLDIIRRNGAHLLALINDILDLSKIEAARLEIENERSDLLETLADVASTMRVRAKERNTALSIEFGTKLPKTIRTDGARLHQVLMNLVGNAVKFTKDGTIRIRASLLAEGLGDGPAVCIEVIDTGIGISKEKLAKLFDPFVQADSSTSREYGGTGLGLTISARIVDLLGGTISVSSEPGKGSTFAVTLPTGNLDGVEMMEMPSEALAAGGADTSHAVIDGNALRGIHILVAEDGPDNQRLIKTLLSKAGAVVTLVEDGSAAVDAVADGVFDVILMDLQMPAMDGYEATKTLRARGCKIPILALTAHAMAADRQKCLAAGCDDHLTKPIDQEELITKIAQWTKGQAEREDRQVETGIRKNAGGEAAPMDPVVSAYANDPDLAVILGEFVSALPGRVRAMLDDLTSGKMDDLKRLAHQLKGAGGSYGYPMLTEAAAGIEAACERGDREGARAGLELLERLCEAVTAGWAAGVGDEVTRPL
jgi:PAS domain S-box-containing protein